MALAAMFTVSATNATLKKKDKTPWALTVRRIVLLVTPTSETWDVMPITKLNQIFGMLAVTATLCGAETALARNYPHLPCC